MSVRTHLPETDAHWQYLKNWMEREPLGHYRQAGEAA
jgi:hypothetical protein